MKFKDVGELVRYLNLHLDREEREYELKRGIPWKELQHQIVKTSMAMANMSGGGHIVIGVSESKSSVPPYSPDGMSDADAKTYSQDDVSAYVNSFADPFVKIDVKRFSDNSRHFVVIQVYEFEDIPIICKKNGEHEIYQGRIYHRTHRQPESSPNITSSEMREILEMAIDKGIIKQLKRIKSYNLGATEKRFEEERQEFDHC